MSRTLNYTVQRVLEKLNLDPVNSINDTEDSLLVAREAESTYFDLLSRNTWPYQEKLLEVNSVSDLSNPTALRLGDEVDSIESLRYNVTGCTDDNTEYRRIIWLEPEDFLEKTYCRNTNEDEVEVSDFFGTEVFVYNDRAPTYYTSFDNKHLLLDSYDSEDSDTLIGSNTVCFGAVIPTWLTEDAFVIPLENKFYPLYLAALASSCSVMLLSTQNVEEERRHNRAMNRLRQEAFRTEAETFPKFKYGRKGNGLA